MNSKNLQAMLNVLNLIGIPYSSWMTEKLVTKEPIYRYETCNLGHEHPVEQIGEKVEYNTYTSYGGGDMGWKCKVCEKPFFKHHMHTHVPLLRRLSEKYIRRKVLEHAHPFEWSVLYTKFNEKEPLWLKKGLKNDSKP